MVMIFWAGVIVGMVATIVCAMLVLFTIRNNEDD